MSDLKNVRNRMNKWLERVDSTSISAKPHPSLSLNGFSTDKYLENNTGIYAWVPLITLMCPSELNTTADQCSSICGVGSCSRNDKDSEVDNNDEMPPAHSPGMRMISIEGNPF